MENDSLFLDSESLIKFDSLTEYEQKELRQFLYNNCCCKWSRFNNEGNEYEYIEKCEEGLQVFIDGRKILYQNVEEDLKNLLRCLSSILRYIEDPISFSTYDRRSYIKTSTLGSFVKMINCSDNCLYAVRVISMNHCSISDNNYEDELVYEITNSVNKLKELSHVNIGRYYESFVSGENLNIVTELVTGETLYDKICDETVTFEDKIKWFKQMASALSYIHDKGILHGNIKPKNIFIKSDGDIKLINFGSKFVDKIIKNNCTKIGANLYSSYENINDLQFDEREDIWALGCIMIELFLGEYTKTRFWDFYNKNSNDYRLKLIEDCKTINDKYGSIIAKMLEPEYQNRCTSKELVEMLN